MQNAKLFEALGISPINPDEDRGMICGSIAMLNNKKAALESFGLVEGVKNKLATFVVELTFVD